MLGVLVVGCARAVDRDAVEGGTGVPEADMVEKDADRRILRASAVGVCQVSTQRTTRRL